MLPPCDQEPFEWLSYPISCDVPPNAVVYPAGASVAPLYSKLIQVTEEEGKDGQP